MEGCGRFFIAAWLAVSLVSCHASTELLGCDKKKVAVLDLDVLFKDEAEGRPPCYPFTLLVTPSNGRVYVTNNLTKDVAPHVAGSHAASWLVAEALKQSSSYTTNLDQADIVFVNDYCYWAWWLAWLNFGTLVGVKAKVDDRTPGDFLVSAYQKMTQTPRWLANKGADFVFFDGHPGFYEGDAKHQIWPIRCGAMQNSIQIVAGTPQRRRCSGFKTMQERLVIAPLMAPIIDPHDEEAYTADMPAFWERVKAESITHALQVPLAERKVLLYFKGRCDPHTKNHSGRLMRNYLAREVFNDADDDVEVACLEDEVAHAELLEAAAVYGEMRDAVFCLMLPDQEQATNAVAGAFISGCIPVFIGPPWHTMPFARAVQYNTTALFFKLEDTSEFFDQQTDPTAATGAHVGAHPQEAQLWQPDMPQADFEKLLVTVKKAGDVLGHLRKFAEDKKELEKRLDAVWSEREKFLYHSTDGSIPGAVETVMQEVCDKSPSKLQVDWAKTHSPSGQTADASISDQTDGSKNAEGSIVQAKAMQRLMGRHKSS